MPAPPVAVFPLISVIVANHNYGRYVREAVDSALSIDWPRVEVIVVDDGSTDDSLPRLDAYRDRILVIRQDNRGQRVANNRGFAASTGQIVIFLDADDILHPAIAQEVMAAWTPATSKAQVQMARIDAGGSPLGSVLPPFRDRPSPAQIRRWTRQCCEYPSPPGSGNIYARAFLDRIFPLGEERDSSTDSTCIAMAPFFGDVITIMKPLVLYRIHGANDSNMLKDERHFAREVVRATKRFAAADEASHARGHGGLRPDALFRGKHLLQLRIASMRLRPADHPLRRDNRARAVADAVAVPFRADFESAHRNLLIAAWSLLAAILPRPAALALIRWRFGPRPARTPPGPAALSPR